LAGKERDGEREVRGMEIRRGGRKNGGKRKEKERGGTGIWEGRKGGL
jgi:hypothetical protein